MLPTTSPARGGGGQKSSPKTREQCLLLTFVAFLVVGTFTFVFLLPGSQANVPVPSTPYPDVRVRDDPLPQRRPDVTPQKNSEESSRFYRETEDRLSLILERISSRENRLEKVLRRLEQRFADPEDREPVPLPDGPTSQASAATTTTSSSSHANENIGPVRDVRESSETPKQKRVAEDTEKLAAVKEAMEHAWGNYKRYAWGFDELQPLTKSGYVTFALIKPDTLCVPSLPIDSASSYKYGAKLRSDIDTRLKAIFVSINESFAVGTARPLWFTENQVDRFYNEHTSQPYYGKLRSLMVSCPSISFLLVSETPNAVGRWREKIGPTNSEKARILSPTSLRALYGTDGTANAFHGSDSVTSALREMEMLFFDPNFDFL